MPRDILLGSNNKDTAKYTMAVAVKMTGIAAHRIRKFEEFGLCKPARTTGKQRLYSDNDISLIRQIGKLEKEGVNMAGVKLILNMQNPEVPRGETQ